MKYFSSLFRINVVCEKKKRLKTFQGQNVQFNTTIISTGLLSMYYKSCKENIIKLKNWSAGSWKARWSLILIFHVGWIQS